ncbi:unnamed protein product [Ostreobium quekettii]|uniref:Condensin complex subunit 2 n=1 Tax=Ostreobium quekettii TaxID=121088 RepID=A0A8S1JBL3_9CHLO|nr:unnamed protein product [Ostreobium quekettii]
MSIPAQEARQAPPWGHRRSDGPASSMGTPDRSQPALLVGPSSDPGRRTSHDSAGSSGRREAGRTPNGALRGQGTPFGSLAKNPKRTTLTREQLLKMVTDCYQLSKHNKLDKRNMWNLTLIDCMPQLVRDQCEEDGTFNFATVTCGLDASVEIYAKRVDCTHSMAMDTLTMSKNRGQSTGGDRMECGREGNFRMVVERTCHLTTGIVAAEGQPGLVALTHWCLSVAEENAEFSRAAALQVIGP